MKKKSFLSGMSAKVALLVMALSGALLTGCYKDDGLDASAPGGGAVLADAVYTITGSVIDAATGTSLKDYTMKVVEPAGATKTEENGSYSVVVGKFSEATKKVTLTFEKTGYTTISRSVILTKVEDGNAAVYPLSVYMHKDALVEAAYTLKFVVKDSKTGAVATGVAAPADKANVKGGEPFTVSTAEDLNYYASLTVIDLPVIYGESVTKIIELFVNPKEAPGPGDPDTYVNIAGNIVDKNGKALKADVKLFDAADVAGVAPIDKASNVDAFRFTINSKASVKKYRVEATYGGSTLIKSGVIDINGGSTSFSLVFDTVGEDVPTVATYALTVNVLDAATNIAIDGVKLTVDGTDYTQGMSLAHGEYTVVATDANGLYYASSTKVTLEKVYSKNEITRVVGVYLTKIPAAAMKAITLYGEVVDKTGKMVLAQKISLSKNPLIKPVYKAKRYAFEVEVPASNMTRSANAYTWMAVAKFLDDNSALTNDIRVGQFNYDGDATITAIYSCIPLTFEVDSSGKVVLGDDGDGAQGDLTPDLDGQGLTTADVSTDMLDKTKLRIKKGTKITDANGNPLTTGIYVTRSTSEEDGNLEDVEGETVLRSYYGSPDGAKFENNPLEIQFKDDFAGELGSFGLEYFMDGKWMTQAGEKGNVVTDKGTYTMNVYHFSKFRAATKGLLEAKDTLMTAEVETMEIGEANYEETVKNVDFTFNYLNGNVYAEPLVDAIKAAGFSNDKAIVFVAKMIKRQLAKQGVVVGESFEKKRATREISVPALSVVNSASATQSFITTVYNFKVNGKTVKVSVKMAGQTNLSIDVTYFGHGHGHGHGHGDDLNAGGGIIMPE